MKPAAVILLLCVLSGCEAEPNYVENKVERTQLEKDWAVMVFEKGGCLCGSQDWDPRGTSEGSIFRYALKDEWEAFRSRPLSETVPFLLNRLGSTRQTNIHTCVYQLATQGEVAVYYLQHLLHANWVEYQGDNKVIREGIAIYREHRQNAIWHVLSDRAARMELKRYFLSIYKERLKTS